MSDIRVLEQGNILFAYRPKVDADVVRSFDDVQRLFIVLQPEIWKYRLIIMGRKRLPEPGPKQRFWGVVDKVTEQMDPIKQEFAAYDYETKTRGVRHQKPVSVITTGTYAIYLHEDHAHLNFSVSRNAREDFGFHIPDYGEYVVVAKNPTFDVRSAFGGGYGFMPLRSTEVLDYPGAQLVLIATDHGAQQLTIRTPALPSIL